MFTEDLDNENTLRFMLKMLSPADYIKHHFESVLEHLYQRPKEDEHEF